MGECCHKIKSDSSLTRYRFLPQVVEATFKSNKVCFWAPSLWVSILNVFKVWYSLSFGGVFCAQSCFVASCVVVCTLNHALLCLMLLCFAHNCVLLHLMLLCFVHNHVLLHLVLLCFVHDHALLRLVLLYAQLCFVASCVDVCTIILCYVLCYYVCDHVLLQVVLCVCIVHQ